MIIAKVVEISKADFADDIRYRHLIKKFLLADLPEKVGDLVMFKAGKHRYWIGEVLDIDRKKRKALFVKKEVCCNTENIVLSVIG